MSLRKCKYCKKKVDQLQILIPQVCKAKECIQSYYEDYSEKVNAKARQNILKAKSKERKEAKEKLKDRKFYLDLAQKTFNTFIRLRDKGKPCMACKKNINGVTHAMHFLSQGNHSSVRFNEDNVWSGCYSCNVAMSGNLLEYRKNLIQEIGIEKLEQLEIIGAQPKKWEIDELKNLIKEYKLKIKEL